MTSAAAVPPVRGQRQRLLRRRGAGTALLTGGTLLAAAALAAAGPVSVAGPRVIEPAASAKIPSTAFYAGKALGLEPLKAVTPAGVYQGNTDQTFLTLTAQARALSGTGHAWRNIGPVGGVADLPNVGPGAEEFLPVEGIGTAIATDPGDPSGNTVYLGTHGGLYKSTDGGATEHLLGDGQFARTAIGAIAVDPHNSSTVYAGTGVSIFTLSDDAVGTGVYVSHDGGATFSRPALNTRGYGVNALTVAPDGTVYAGTTYGLWRSTDHGASFTKVPLPDNATHTAPASNPLGSWVTAIAIKPGSSAEVTVAVGYAFGKKVYPDGSVLAPGNGLYRSTTGGAPGSFSYFAGTAGLTNPAASSDPFGRTSLAYSPVDPNVVWALVSDAGRAAGQNLLDTPTLPAGSLSGNSTLNGLYRSADDGATWHIQGTPQTLLTALGGSLVPEYPLGYGVGVQSTYNNWVQADPKNVNQVYLGLEEAFQGVYHDPTGALPTPSTTFTAIEKYANLCGFYSAQAVSNFNGASCPQQVPFYGSGTTHPDQHSAAFAATPAGYRLYSGNDGGWWAQDAHTLTDTTTGFDNASWRSLNHQPTVLPWDLTRLQDGSYLLALQDNGTAHVRPDGTAYSVCGGDGLYAFPGANAKSYYCGIDGGIIYATTDDFATTVPITPGVPGATFLSPWAADATNPNHLVATGGAIEETTQGPNSVTYDPTGTAQLSTTWATVYTPPASPSGAAWDTSAMTVRGALTYAAMCAKCRPSLASGTAANPTVVNTRIATNYRAGCTPAELAGTCWHQAASIGLPHQQVGGIAFDPRHPNVVFVGLRQEIVLGADPAVTGAQKVMMSTDGGEHFTDLSGNLPRADVHGLVLRDGVVYVATDVGVFAAKAGSSAWQRFGAGLPQVAIRSMKLDLTGRYLMAGAFGRGGYVYDFGAAAAVPPTVLPAVPTRAHSSSAVAGSAAPGGALATTGLPAGLAAAGLALTGAGLLLRRARRRSTG